MPMNGEKAKQGSTATQLFVEGSFNNYVGKTRGVLKGHPTFKVGG